MGRFSLGVCVCVRGELISTLPGCFPSVMTHHSVSQHEESKLFSLRDDQNIGTPFKGTFWTMFRPGIYRLFFILIDLLDYLKYIYTLNTKKYLFLKYFLQYFS